MEEINQLYKSFEGKRILILTKQKLHYDAKVISVSQNEILFFDKFANKILLPISEIIQITEVENANNR